MPDHFNLSENVLEIRVSNAGFQNEMKNWMDIIKITPGLILRFYLSISNGHWADDILNWANRTNLSYPQFALEIVQEDLDSYAENRNRFFHLSGFFDYLAKRVISDPEQKAFYTNLSHQLAGISKPLEAGVYTPPPVQKTSSTKRINKEVRKLFRPVKTVSKKIIHSFKTEQGLRKINAVAKPHPSDWQQVLITGWYGTETTGDKAILGEIIYTLRQFNPHLKVIVTSIDWKVSYQTNVEMGMEDVEIIGINNAYAPELIEKVDAVIMGGGPLMESRQIINIWRMFMEANQQQKARVIFGCGVGPIHTEEMRQKIGDILKVSTAGFFRDEPSRDYARSLGADTDFPVACDPAIAYVNRWQKNRGIKKKAMILLK